MALLVPIDFSDCTPALVGQAADLAARLGTGLTLLHSVHPPAGLERARLEGPTDARTAADLLTAEASTLLARYIDQARAHGVGVIGITRRGIPGEIILTTAAQIGAEMIVMGTHGRRGVTRVLLGSIAEYVIRRATIPVVTLRTQHHEECDARSCATCAADHTPIQRQLEAELDG